MIAPTLLTLTGDEDAAVDLAVSEQVALGVWPWLAKAAGVALKVGAKLGKKAVKAIKAKRAKRKAKGKAAAAARAVPAAAPGRPAAAPGRPGAPGAVSVPGSGRPAGPRDLLIGAAIVGGVLLLATQRRG